MIHLWKSLRPDWSNLGQWKFPARGRGLEPDNLQGLFQPKAFQDSLGEAIDPLCPMDGTVPMDELEGADAESQGWDLT